MGCSQSSPSPVQKMKFDRTPTVHNFGKNKNLNKADYIYSQKKNEVLIKSPKEIDGQQFIIEESEHCDMFLIDHMGMLTIDYCTDCRIVTGPVASSVFIRNCDNCVIVLACQQLRLRDCKNLTIFLHSTTGPIIESSKNISIGCYNYAYFGLESNLTSADMSVWENEWYSVYDFTPAASNYTLLPSGDPSTYIETVVPASSALIDEGLCSSSSEARITPLLYGKLEPCGKSALYLIQPKHGHIFRNIMDTFVQTHGTDGADKLVILRTSKKKLSTGQLITLLGGDKALKNFTTFTNLIEPYELIACELSYAKSANDEAGKTFLHQLAEAVKGATEFVNNATEPLEGKYVSWSDEEADEKSDMIFEKWRVKT